MIASVGTYSGPAAATLGPALQGAQLWVRHINHKGGLNGHPVEFLVYDDGGDPARHRSLVQDAVERRQAVAFLSQNAAITGSASVEYLTAKRVPVIGSEGGTAGFYKSPMYFPQHSHSEALFKGWVATTADRARAVKQNKLALVYCAEAQDCTTFNRVMNEQATGAGLDLVYQAKASIAQPDYTAECLAARNAGAQLFFVLLDGNSVSRFAAACARQGFRPHYLVGGSVALDRFKSDANLEGLVASSSVFPYFQSGSPASDEFQSAYRSFGGSMTLGIGVATGWVAGKLLETAGAALADPPTSQSILQGLWGIRNNTLGGLTAPLTFTEGQPAQPITCWFNIGVQKDKWVSLDGYQEHCR